LCGAPLETAATAQNPSATIRANSLARCPSCLLLYVIGSDRQPVEPTFPAPGLDAAIEADPELEEWAAKTQEAARLRDVAEIKAECVAAREWLTACGGPGLAADLATLDAYVAGFDAKGIASASRAVRLRAVDILAQMRRQTRH
jgi:hypothetical protein